ncbi:Inosine/uridine-preferring nucleoside hydrolase domain-containing protein [Fimicolochytrium jonesii]|uniref:Inosine/uridine-preferring nucleoside hydrolase domain-containing protein n=1 Tax=Fimicolochytrium jonesii TaxID=1396493 RepID=UPI0022FE8FF2|nr:Inosine/uridine-preferring nucleoside hydrolase domain-containing protein [Fimicolochytrium jonesii]KAI8824391.1 Inosine/uridine-preferring nucleoside hydrolase domain-containing protein [Fimicolochytrium jonesii]
MTNTKHSVIVDTDPGVDDALALLFAFGSPNIDIRAITVTQGNTTLQNSFRNLKQILTVQAAHERYLAEHKTDATVNAPGTLLSRDEPVVVALGAGKPLEGEPTYAHFYHGDDGLGFYFKDEKLQEDDLDQTKAVAGATKAANPTQEDKDAAKELYTLSARSAEDEILHQLETHPEGTVSIVALGPLTNVAKAIQKDPLTMKRVKHIFTMGGAIDHPGNITPVAEFNWHGDTLAAHIVIASDLPVRVVPLDVTMVSSIVDSHYLKTHAEPLQTPLSNFVSTITDHVLGLTERTIGFRWLFMHDPLTIGALVDPTLLEFTPLDFQVEPTGTFTKGMCVVDRRTGPKGTPASKKRTNIEVALKGDTHKFLVMFYKTLFGLDWDKFEKVPAKSSAS